MSIDDTNDFSYCSSSEDHHEQGKSLHSYREEDQRLILEQARQKEERRAKESKAEQERLYEETYGPFNRQLEHWRNVNDPIGIIAHRLASKF